MARLTLKLLLALALLALALPTAASARKNAWQLVALSGTYAYHATANAPAACDPNENSTGDGVLLSRDYTASFHADSFPSYQYAAKYFPVFGGPQTNALGQKAHLVGQATSNESYRTFTVAGGACSQQDQSCSKPQTIGTARFMFSVTHKKFRFNGPLETSWNIDFVPTIPN